MNKLLKFSSLTAVVTVLAFSLSRVLWPDTLSIAPPNAVQKPFFSLLEIVEALAFGFGTSFIVFGWKLTEYTSFKTPLWLTRLTFLSVAWLMISWWPHDNWHRVILRENYTALLQVEYAFHITLIIAGFIISYFLWMLYERGRDTVGAERKS